MSNDSVSNITRILAIATVFLALSTLALAIFAGTQTTALVNQSKTMQKDFDINNRPWLAGDQITVFEYLVKYDIQNFGKIPNEQSVIKFYVIKSDTAAIGLSKDQLPFDRFKTEPLTVVMPTQKMSIILSGDILKAIEEIKDTGGFLQLVIILDYKYGNEKSGEYGYMGKYNVETNSFDIIETWAK